MRAFGAFGKSLFYLLTFSVILVFGCSKSDDSLGGETLKHADESPEIVRVGQSSITSKDFESYIADKLYPMRTSQQRVRQLLDERILEEVLYREALRVGLDQNPEIQRDIRQMYISRLIDDYMKREVWEKQISDAELQEYYDDHWDEFNRPDQVRVADIFIAAPEDMDVKKREELKGKAESVLEKALSIRGERFGFSRLIKAFSDTPEQYKKGDTGFIDHMGHPAGVDKVLADAAFNLSHVGDLAEYVVETPGGFHVIMLTGQRTGVSTPLENVRQRLAQRMRREKADRIKKEYIQRLKAETSVQIDEKAFKDVMEGLKTNREAATERLAPPGRGSHSPPALPAR